MRLDHVGLAVRDAERIAALYRELLGCDVVHEERFGDMKIVFLDVENSYFELLEPMDGGIVSKYLETHGPGIHHLALATEDIEAALASAREHGFDLVDEEPRPGSWGHEVAFLHPRSTGGTLIEFVEHTDE